MTTSKWLRLCLSITVVFWLCLWHVGVGLTIAEYRMTTCLGILGILCNLAALAEKVRELTKFRAENPVRE